MYVKSIIDTVVSKSRSSRSKYRMDKRTAHPNETYDSLTYPLCVEGLVALFSIVALGPWHDAPQGTI